MKKILLFGSLLMSVSLLAQKKLVAQSTTYFTEAGANDGIDSSSHNYATFLGSLYSNAPVFEATSESPVFWNWISPDPSSTTTDVFFDGTLQETFTNAYNSNNQMISNTSSENYRNLLTYHSSGKLLTATFELFVSGNWETSSSTVNEYDALDRLVVSTEYYYNNSTQLLQSRDSLFYQGNTTQLLRQAKYLSPDGLILEPNETFEYTYSGNLPISLRYYTDEDNDPQTPITWLVDAEYNYTAGRATSFIGYFVVMGVPTTSEAIHIDYTYDASNRLFEIDQYGQFGLFKQEFTYDTDGFVTQVNNYYETNAGNSLYLSNIEKYYYISTASIDESEQVAVEMYPNPGKDFVTITSESSIEMIQITSMDGKVILKQKGTDTIDVSFLTAGNYFVDVYTSNGVARKKMSKI